MRSPTNLTPPGHQRNYFSFWAFVGLVSIVVIIVVSFAISIRSQVTAERRFSKGDCVVINLTQKKGYVTYCGSTFYYVRYADDIGAVHDDLFQEFELTPDPK